MEKVIGIVQKGGGNGSKYGFPTANIKWKKLPKGVPEELYWAITIVDKNLYHVVAWHVSRKLLECHLIRFNGDLYGRELEIVLIKKLPVPKPPKKNRKQKYEMLKEAVIKQSQFD